MTQLTQLQLPHGTLNLPVFLPDGTQGVVRSVDAADLAACQIQGVQMNVFHLMQRPSSTVIQALGGLHRMAGWQRPIFTDSGGFQVYSLIRQNPKSGSINNRGATFRLEGKDRKYNLTPEKSVQMQLSYGSDVVICFDDCTHVDDPREVQAGSVARTVAWARRCKEEFNRIVGQRRDGGEKRPLLIAVVQGGGDLDLRRQCADQLLEIGFDGYGYGGWPLDNEGNLLTDILAYTREIVPLQFTLHALGVGHPGNVAAAARMGYNIFDSTMPTRDARHGRLYSFAVEPKTAVLRGDDWFHYAYINDKKHLKQSQPISPYCDAPCCQNYSLGYLHHLFKLNDSLFPRLATIHNLRFMTQLMENLRQELNR
ncbi:MAG: queuine tRNA-ribosyltransferase family protein [Ardenticatenaceae bacterium]|nr:queuine tRNA-ribosyltransferase family protein [Ardenticatenaceae bacterium]